jgi:hypothetical protein
MRFEVYWYLVCFGIAFLVISRIVIVKLARSPAQSGRYPEIASMGYVATNFPSEASRELSAMWKAGVSNPRTLIGALAALHVSVWFLGTLMIAWFLVSRAVSAP